MAGTLSIEILKWNKTECVWNQIVSHNTGKTTYSACQLKADNKYVIYINGQKYKILKTDQKGYLKFDVNTKSDLSKIRIQLINK